ncbi:hypothetical protein KP509_02G030100 [Ceratopteris richardii]|nr:hypothetical protein KP509_02G030100 [Ceratopteris richardii]
MPGSIHVSVLEAFNLPEEISDGEELAVKVSVGAREFQTEPKQAFGGRTTPWSLDFAFPVLNFRDNLLVMLIKNGDIMSKEEINTPSIMEKGSFETNLLLNCGGTIHLLISFVLTDEERQRIDKIREAALKKKEQESRKLSSNEEPVGSKTDDKSPSAYSGSVKDEEQLLKEVEQAQKSDQSGPEPSDGSQSDTIRGLSEAMDQQSSKGLESSGESDITDQIDCSSPSCDKIQSQDIESSAKGSQEVNNSISSPSSVKDKIKVFESTRAKLPSAQYKGSPRKNTEIEAGHEALPKRDSNYEEIRGTEKTVEPLYSFSEDEITVKDSEGQHCRNELDNNDELKLTDAENSSKHERDEGSHKNLVKGKEAIGATSKQNKSIDLTDVSKQMVNGAFIGAVSGAVLIALGAFLWNTNREKKRKLTARKGSKQATR